MRAWWYTQNVPNMGGILGGNTPQKAFCAPYMEKPSEDPKHNKRPITDSAPARVVMYIIKLGTMRYSIPENRTCVRPLMTLHRPRRCVLQQNMISENEQALRRFQEHLFTRHMWSIEIIMVPYVTR